MQRPPSLRSAYRANSRRTIVKCLNARWAKPGKRRRIFRPLTGDRVTRRKRLPTPVISPEKLPPSSTMCAVLQVGPARNSGEVLQSEIAEAVQTIQHSDNRADVIAAHLELVKALLAYDHVTGTGARFPADPGKALIGLLTMHINRPH